MERATSRRPRLKRVSDPPAMVVTERDREIIRAVHEHRFLRRDQIARLFFSAGQGAKSDVLLSSCNARLQRLYQHGFLARRMPVLQDGSAQAVYALDRRGAELIASETGADHSVLRWSPKRRRSELYFLEHTLAVNAVWVAFVLASKGGGVVLTDWAMDAPRLWDSVTDESARRGRLPVRPDSFFTLRFGGQEAHFFLELDRGTMPLRRFAEKVRAYRRYWKDGGFRARYRARSFRVLTVTTGATRRENLRRVAAAQEARGMFLFATLADVQSDDVLGPIWYVPHRDEPLELTA